MFQNLQLTAAQAFRDSSGAVTPCTEWWGSVPSSVVVFSWLLDEGDVAGTCSSRQSLPPALEVKRGAILPTSMSYTTMNITFTEHYVGRTLFGRGEPGCFHSFDWLFKFGSYERAQVSSLWRFVQESHHLVFGTSPTRTMRLHNGAIVAPWIFHGLSNALQVCGNRECYAECGAQFCDILRLPLLTHALPIGDQHPTGKEGVELYFSPHGVIHRGVMNGIPAFPERFNPSCHCAIWQRCTSICFTNRSVLRLRAT